MGLVDHLDAVFLDDGVGQDVVSDLLHFDPDLIFIGAFGDREFEVLALAHIGDALVAEARERSADGLPLRVENGGLHRDVNACLHVGSFRGYLLSASMCFSNALWISALSMR